MQLLWTTSKLLYWRTFYPGESCQDQICDRADVGVSVPEGISAVLNHSNPIPFQLVSTHYPTKHGGQSSPVSVTVADEVTGASI